VATTCSGDDPDAALRAPSAERWHAGAAFGVFGSDLSFGGGPAFSMERRAVSASFEYRASVTTTVGGGAGAGLGGLMVVDGARYTIGLGWLLTASYSRRLVDGRGRAPFVLLGVSLGASGASTQPQAPRSTAPPPTTGLYAFDVRAGLTVGKTFWSVLSPYASLRAYGGPVIWTYKGKTVVGSDDYHVQGAFGVAAALPEGWDAFAEGAPGGERGVTVGIGRSF
jgi:hypothetical protein